MKLGTNFGPFGLKPVKEIIDEIKELGFDAIDFSLGRDYGVTEENEKEFFTDIKEYCAQKGLWISQAHAPFGTPNFEPEGFLSEEVFLRSVTAIRRASYVGAPWLVFHPWLRNVHENETYIYNEEERKIAFETDYKFFKRLEPYFKQYGVNCAIENLAAIDGVTGIHKPSFCSCSKDLKELLDALNDDIYGVCYDVGHLNLMPEGSEGIAEFVYNLGDKIKVLHLHDNFGWVTCWGGDLDRHQLPFMGSVPWKELKQALIDVGFNGSFSFEVGKYGPNEEWRKRFAKQIYDSGRLILSDEF